MILITVVREEREEDTQPTAHINPILSRIFEHDDLDWESIEIILMSSSISI
jgi:hypothetical protein